MNSIQWANAAPAIPMLIALICVGAVYWAVRFTGGK